MRQTQTEYYIWGVPPGGDGEVVLVSEVAGEPITSPQIAARVAEWCRSKGATAVRIQTIRLDDDLAKDWREAIR